ncbi:MAG: beta-aspartyl-peptidase [Lacrimispora sp.]
MMNIIKLLKNADVYAPEHLGLRDILICDTKIASIEPRIDATVPGLEVVDLKGQRLVPGYMDGHTHITGGGGENSFSSRVPESRISEVVSTGVTTVLGLLGTDTVTRSSENLLAKAREFEQNGISAYMLTGGYRYPSPLLTGSIMNDIVLIDKVIGVKIAVSDHRSSATSTPELARLCSDARVGGMISGKAGLVVMHMGSSAKGLKPIYEMLEYSDVPMGNILPTHCERCEPLFTEAVQYAKKGGNFDLTAATPDEAKLEGGAAHFVRRALDAGADISHITISSDSYGSIPVFNEKMECVGISYAHGPVLHDEIRRMVEAEGISIETALCPITKNVAERMGLRGKKGIIAPGADADFVVWDNDMNIEQVFAKGKTAFENGRPLLRGRYE